MLRSSDRAMPMMVLSTRMNLWTVSGWKSVCASWSAVAMSDAHV
jgi:hypothetical protein